GCASVQRMAGLSPSSPHGCYRDVFACFPSLWRCRWAIYPRVATGHRLTPATELSGAGSLFVDRLQHVAEAHLFDWLPLCIANLDLLVVERQAEAQVLCHHLSGRLDRLCSRGNQRRKLCTCGILDAFAVVTQMKEEARHNNRMTGRTCASTRAVLGGFPDQRGSLEKLR